MTRSVSGAVGPSDALERADALAGWAARFVADGQDRELAARSLIDTLAVLAAGRGHRDAPLGWQLGEAGRLAMLAHLIDYDDLHLPSTSHISAVCVPAALATGGQADAYLAGAGVMARLGTMLGWRHYERGWHATCTAGAFGAAAAAAVALGLDADGIATALALAVPAAGGVNRAFGTSAKSLQVAFAADAGVRAARLAAAGAVADRGALGQWLQLVGGGASSVDIRPAIPGGLAVKTFPCCYALQRPIAAVLAAVDGQALAASDVARVTVRAPRDSLRPLIHARPRTGLEGKFSLEYGIAAAILDGPPGLGSFSDAAVARSAARDLVDRVRVVSSPGGGGLLAGSVKVELHQRSGQTRSAENRVPPGAPQRPPPRSTCAARRWTAPANGGLGRSPKQGGSTRRLWLAGC